MKEELLSLNHQRIVQDACDRLCLPLSEYNFANLYLFRKTHQYRFVELGPERQAIKGISYRKQTFLMPLFHPNDWNELRWPKKLSGK